MQSAFIAKEQLNADTPLFFFDCTLADGTAQHWSSRTFTWGGTQYEPRVIRHNLFEAQMASDTQVGGVPRLTFELANADSQLSEIDQQTGFKGAQLTVQSVFVDLVAGVATTDPVVVFRGLMNPPEMVTETTFRLSAINRMSMQRTVLPNVRVERMCPWRFPSTAAQRLEAVDGGAARGAFSLFYRCGYSPDQANGAGNMNGSAPFTNCAYTRSDCVERGMFTIDSTNRITGRFGGLEYVPPTITVRGAGQQNSSLSAVQENTASYNDFVPLVYGTQWHLPDVVFSRNDGNLTRMEVLLGMGEIEGILTVLVNDIVIPKGVSGVKMTSTGWYNLITPGTRNGAQDPNFADASGVPLGDPFGSMAYLSVVVPNSINNGTSIPSVQVLMQGLKLWQCDASGNYLGAQFSSNPAWVLLDVLMRAGYSFAEIDTSSFAVAAAYADQLLSVDDPVGGSVQVPRFQCNFALKESSSIGELIRSLRNGARVYLVLNTAGLLEARIENTFALQQPALPANSNALTQFNGGWPAYEFGSGSIARNSDGSASVKLSSKGAQDTPNRLTIEFQDSFNQYQQDSLSLADEDDIDLCGQEIPTTWDAVGISTFDQAARMLLLGLNRAIEGNLFIQFETSVKALGLLPGDLITVTYPKENLVRTPFRVQKITSGPSLRTAVISAQLHDDLWYTDTATGIIGGLGRQTGQGSGLPAPVCGTVVDAYGNLQLGITETEISSSDGSSAIELGVSFTAPSGRSGTLAAPLIGLSPVVSATGGTLGGGLSYFYGISAVDSGGGESGLSFIAQVATATGTNTNSVILDGIVLPAGSAGFNVYRGSALGQFLRIASNQTPQSSFTDTGLAPLAILPPDPQFDHVNVYWRWELTPEAAVTLQSTTTVGNSALELTVNEYALETVRITRGAGAGQESSIVSNTASTITIATPWQIEPDATSFFVISESSWRFGAMGATSPIPIDVPERIGEGVQISALAANVAGDEAAYGLSPLTRWVLGQSDGLSADSSVPPAPRFSATVSPLFGGLDFSGVAFAALVNTTSVIAGTFRTFYYDEVNGAAPVALNAAIAATDQTVLLTGAVASGALLQIDQEVLLAANTDAGGNTSVQRGMQGTTAANHLVTAVAYVLQEKIVIVPFVKNYFGTPAGGDWKYTLELPDVRVASVELIMTNALGNGPAAVNSYTATNDSGLRTNGGGQFSFQITGYLAIQTGAAPLVIVDSGQSVRDMYAVLITPSSGAGVTLQLNRNGVAYATLQFAAGATVSNVVNGFGLPALNAGDQLSLDVDGVGTTNPGSDLTVIMRL